MQAHHQLPATRSARTERKPPREVGARGYGPPGTLPNATPSTGGRADAFKVNYGQLLGSPRRTDRLCRQAQLVPAAGASTPDSILPGAFAAEVCAWAHKKICRGRSRH